MVGRPQLRRSPLSRYASPFRRKAKFGRSQRLKAAIVGLSAPSCRRVAGAGLRAPGAHVHGHGHTTQRPPRPSIIVRILGDVSEAEAGTGSGLLNAVQQFSGAIVAAVLGTVFFQRVSADGEFVGATQVVLLLGTVLYGVTLVLVGLFPNVAQEEHA